MSSNLTRPTLLTAALAAAERGWHVFPLRVGAKQPALRGYDRCPRTGACADNHQGWEQRATTDPDRIRAAWTGPGASFNVGIACGPSGLVVIDLDTAKPGEVPPPAWAETVGVQDGHDVFTVLPEQGIEYGHRRAGTVLEPLFERLVPQTGEPIHQLATHRRRDVRVAGLH
jgi:hypothetical protein